MKVRLKLLKFLSSETRSWRDIRLVLFPYWGASLYCRLSGRFIRSKVIMEAHILETKIARHWVKNAEVIATMGMS